MSLHLPARPLIITARLRAEPVTRHHAPAMVPLLASPALHQFQPTDPPSLEKLRRQYEFLEGGRSPAGDEHWLTWILQHRAQGTSLGFIQATIREPETVTIAYTIGASHWKQGYANEAVSGMLTLVFNTYQVNKAVAEMDTRNTASIALVRSLGFTLFKTVKDADSFKGSTSHEHVYETTKSAWTARHRDAAQQHKLS